MELQALLVLCGVGVAGVAVLLLMSLFSSSGTSYEEAIAQQRKATTELLALAENKNKNNKKSNKKAIKKQAKKERKESAVPSTSSDHESEAPGESGVEDDTPLTAPKTHVEFSPLVVVDTPRESPNVKIRKRGKDPKVKPILVNKEDPSCVSDPALAAAPATILNHFDEILPKDEFELLQSSLAAERPQEKVEEPVEKKEAKAPKAPKTRGAASKAAPAVEAVQEDLRERRDSGDSPKEQRKAKKSDKKVEKPVEEVAEVVEEVIPPLNAPQPSELTTEKLLKQALVAPPASAPAPAPSAATATPPGGKKKKKNEPNVLTMMAGDSGGVNVGELVRVVREAALSRTEIQILTDALLNKHHDPLPMHSEWSEGPNDPMQKLKKQLADKDKALADEMEASQALHAKLKELRVNLNASRSQLAGVQRSAEAAEATARAELHTQQARLTRLLEENHALAQEKIMLQQKLGAEGEAQAQRVQMEMHIQRLSETEAALLQQLAALQAECGAHALDANAARDTCIMAQQHAAEMAQQLQEANRAYAELEQQRQMAVHNEQRAQLETLAAQERLNAMADLQNEVQRLSSRVQAAEANADAVKEEAEKQKEQLSSEIASLGELLAARETELAEVKQLKAAPAQNGLPAAAEQHKAAELAAVESVVESLREELGAAQGAARDQREQLRALQDQLLAYRDKNNEAVSKAQEAQYTEVASVLRTACPAAAPGAAAGRDWLVAFADNLKKELQKRDAEKQELEKRVPEKIVVEKVVEKIVEPAADSRVGELQAQNEQLQGLVDKYKRVIDDTEGVLSRLQQNVTTEEARWARQLADKQRELDELRTRTLHQMQSKIDALESQLAKAINHEHSFADAERQTEERLMAGLSEKHNLDVCNGPSQVGLEDK